MTTDPQIDLIPPAFHILWEASLNDSRLLTSDPTTLFTMHDLDLNNSMDSSSLKGCMRFHPRPRSWSESSSSGESTNTPTPRRHRQDPTIRLRENPELKLTRQQSADLTSEMASLYAKETAAVCILECERGEKLVKKSFYDIVGGGKFWMFPKTEDYFLNWLNADLTSQHASAVDVSVYFSGPPQSTTSDGLRLWLDNLKEQGKVVTMSVKLASLGHLHPAHQAPGRRHHHHLQHHHLHHHHSNGLHGIMARTANQNEEKELEDDSLEGLRRLQESDVLVSTIAPYEWPELLNLLADKMALRRMENSHVQSANQLRALLSRDSSHDNSV